MTIEPRKDHHTTTTSAGKRRASLLLLGAMMGPARVRVAVQRRFVGDIQLHRTVCIFAHVRFGC
jgi:hypothetical protein